MRYLADSNGYTHIFNDGKANGVVGDVARHRPTPGNQYGGPKPEVLITFRWYEISR